jgi:ATP-binding cassette subfamily C protein LapB
VVIYLIGGPIVWVPLVAIPVMILAALAVQPKLRALIKESQEGGHHKHAILVETLSGLETIKALGAGASMRRRWQEAVVHQSHVGLQTRMLSQLTGNIANAAQQFTQVLVRPRAALAMAVSTRQAIVRCRVWRMAGERSLATTGDRP